MECKKGGIKPIIGYEAYLRANSRLDRDAQARTRTHHPPHAAGEEQRGVPRTSSSSPAWRTSRAFTATRGSTVKILEAHSEGLICLSGCLAGEFNQYITKNKPDEAAKAAKWFRKQFSARTTTSKIQNNGIGLQDECTPVAVDISDKLGIPLVATADARYLCSEDARALDVLFCINTGQMHDPKKKKYPEERMPNPYYVRSPENMYKAVPELRGRGGSQSANRGRRRHRHRLQEAVLPGIHRAGREEHRTIICASCAKGGCTSGTATTRPRRCVSGSTTSSTPSPRWGSRRYFLVVWDFVRFAREGGIPCTARGSGCGAIVCVHSCT